MHRYESWTIFLTSQIASVHWRKRALPRSHNWLALLQPKWGRQEADEYFAKGWRHDQGFMCAQTRWKTRVCALSYKYMYNFPCHQKREYFSVGGSSVIATAQGMPDQLNFTLCMIYYIVYHKSRNCLWDVVVPTSLLHCWLYCKACTTIYQLIECIRLWQMLTHNSRCSFSTSIRPQNWRPNRNSIHQPYWTSLSNELGVSYRHHRSLGCRRSPGIVSFASHSQWRPTAALPVHGNPLEPPSSFLTNELYQWGQKPA